VEYYAPNRKVERDIREARWLPFFKHENYSHQEEYRLAAALKGGLRLTQRVVDERFTFEEEVAAGKPTERHVFIGSHS